jgi:hypothetical protein
MKYSVYGVIGAVLLLMPAAFAQGTAVEQLQSGLAAAPSATRFLTDRCAALKLADPAVIRAVREQAPTPDLPGIRKALQVSASERLGYRRVLLICGTHILSEASNWYVPSRLTPVQNYQLDNTDTSFGTVVKTLDFHRQQLSSKPVNEPGVVLRVIALLKTPDERPFSFVSENYTNELTADARP